MMVAPVRRGQTGGLRMLLATMNRYPGVVAPENTLVPFAQFDRLHFARFVVLEDRTSGDLAEVGEPTPTPCSDALALLLDFDGGEREFVTSFAFQAESGLRQIFAYCEGFSPGTDLQSWLWAHRAPAATAYVNWIGRTVQQIQEEKRLRAFIEEQLGDGRAWQGVPPVEVHARLRQSVCSARILPAPAPRTPWGWQLADILNLLAVPLLLILFLPLILLAAVPFLFILRQREFEDPEIDLAATKEETATLASLEDHDVTNQFSAIGWIKPGWFRRITLRLILWLTSYAVRHFYGRGYLTRVSTIHFARWVFLDNYQRLFFASNYDGSQESYMDDFINKVGWGLNLVFSNGVGYPKTDCLVAQGSKDEQKFKRFLKRHQLATEVWYAAEGGLTAPILESNTLIRQGLERPRLSPPEAEEWLRLF